MPFSPSDWHELFSSDGMDYLFDFLLRLVPFLIKLLRGERIRERRRRQAPVEIQGGKRMAYLPIGLWIPDRRPA
ncbi:MAG: hypothetical protein ABJA98_26915 [Acidobacteriota bacterium]